MMIDDDVSILDLAVMMENASIVNLLLKKDADFKRAITNQLVANSSNPQIKRLFKQKEQKERGRDRQASFAGLSMAQHKETRKYNDK